MFNKKLSENIILLVIICIATFFSSNLSFDYPDFVHELLDEPLYKILIIGLLLFISTKSLPIALILLVIITLVMCNIPMVSETFLGPPVSYCPVYGEKEKIDEIGTAFYPLNDNSDLQKMRGGI